MRHIRLVEEDIPTCYIAVNQNQKPVFRQWVFKHEENQRIQNYFGSLFPLLNEKEVLLEGGFTHPNHRGKSIMSKAILNIVKLNTYTDTKRIITFVDKKNIASLKGLSKAQFTPYIIRKKQWLFFNRKVSFVPLSPENKNDYFKLLRSKLK